MAARRDGWGRWIGLWLRCYPRDFRSRFGADLRSQYPRPDRGVARAAIVAAVELARGGIGARLDARERSGSRGWAAAATAELATAWRGIRRRPAMFVAVGATLAVASSLTIAVFAIADAALLRPLPYPDDGQLVSVGNSWTGFPHSSVSTPEYDDYRQRARSFQAAAVYQGANLNLAAEGGLPERIQGARVTASFFDVFRLPPQLGRPFTEDEQRSGAAVAVISHALWMRRFAGDPAVVGRTLATDAGPRTVVGVMPPAFQFPSRLVDVWIPAPANERPNRGAHTRWMVARLADGVSVERAGDEMREIALVLQREHPDYYPDGSGWSAGVRPLRRFLAGDVEAALWILSVAVGALMLLGCANVAGLMIARHLDGRHERAVSVALGASGRHLLMRAIWEGLLVGAASGLIALVGAEWLYAALQQWLPDGVARPASLMLDPRTLFFAVAMTSAAGAIAALVSAVRGGAATTDLLRGTRTVTDAGTRRIRTALATAQVAAAVALLVAGGYAARSFARFVATDVGFSTDDVVTARVALSPIRYPSPAAQIAFVDRLAETLRQRPGVSVVGAASLLPLTGDLNDSSFLVEGYVPSAAGLLPNAQTRVVSDDYFRALAIPIQNGRAFDARDTIDATPVAIVSASLARRYWPNGDAVGRRIHRFPRATDRPWTTVVGIAGDIRHVSPMLPPEPILYYPLRQLAAASFSVVARLDRGRADAADASRLIGDAVRALDPEQPLWLPRTMTEWRSRSTEDAKLTLSLLALFGAVAVILAAIGIFGVIAHGVARRRREFGVRLALGAVPSRLMFDVVGRGLVMAAIGAALGLAAARAIGDALAPVFPDVVVRDPWVWLGVIGLVAIIAVAASVVPARRAMRVSPVETLRGEG
jgi:putative ABC transport system permease protein